MTTTYWDQVDRFNAMYKLPRPETPTNPDNQWLGNFKSILQEELNEIHEVMGLEDPKDRLVALSDWLGDLIVYCSTEARRHGLPMPKILDAIMESNFSKLGDDGKPIYDARGKVKKGPGFFGPEERIKEILTERVHDVDAD